MRSEQVKEYITRLALCGANMLMLYTEDVYTLEEYPHFGYLRGAYTDEELLDIDAHAASLGVEVIPCIQTLGHMAQYLTWKEETRGIKDTDSVMLCESEDTYRFIEAAVSKMSRIFRSRRIHIGMDESENMGLGKYLRQHGYQDRLEIFNRHIERVLNICKKYNVAPMMWSDMFFKLINHTKNVRAHHYAHEAFTYEGKIPEVEMVCWSYYLKDEEGHAQMIKGHQPLGRPLVFAGTVYTTRGFVPNYQLTYECAIPGVKACIHNNVKDVLATMWGDDGCETDYFDALYGFAVYSELCYNEHATMNDMRCMGELISGVPTSTALASDEVYLLDRPKLLVWGDSFYNVTGVDFSKETQYLHLQHAAESCEDEYVRLVLRIEYIKAHLYATLYHAYKQHEDLSVWRDELLPQLLADYKRLYELHSEKYLRVNKPFGYEVLQSRYVTAIERTQYALDRICALMDGSIDKIEELEAEPRYGDVRKPWYSYIAFGRVMDFY